MGVAGKRVKNKRLPEKGLLLLVGAYALCGSAVLYPVFPVGKAWHPLAACAGAAVLFLGVSFYWGLTNYRGDCFITPVVAALVVTGLVFLWRLEPVYGFRQFAWLSAGAAVLVFTTSFKSRLNFLGDYKYLYAAAGSVLLLLPVFFGKEQGGARSWLDFGLFSVQPSEFVKILVVLFLASYLVENRAVLVAGTKSIGPLALPSIREWGPLAVMWGISLLILVFQKDLGTALVYFCTFLAMVYAATARIFYVVAGFFLFLAGAFGSYILFGHVRERVQVWLDPWPYADSAGYQVVQSLFAIGSGGLTGTGLGQGCPYFIPAVHTDTIFSAICEELGLCGAIFLVALFMILVYRGMRIALLARDEFSSLVAAGITVLLGLQAFIILAGVTKLLPLTGITLPFVSYGGSSLVANFILVGLLLNISHEAEEFNEE